MRLRYFVIKKEQLQEANEYCKQLGFNDEVFIEKLYKDNEHSHYWTNLYLTDEQYKLMSIRFTRQFESYFEALEEMKLHLESEVKR